MADPTGEARASRSAARSLASSIVVVIIAFAGLIGVAGEAGKPITVS
jgi:hypothetical protein